MRYYIPNIRVADNEMPPIKSILDSGWVASGKYVQQFEESIKTFTGAKHAICCSSCTQGLVVAFKVLGIKNCKVALPSFTWPSTLYALECNGNSPVFADIDPNTWLMDLGTVSNYDSIISVDVFGNQTFAHKDQQVIDAAHGIGLPKLGKRADIEVVSFSFTKLVTSMQGGVILTNRDDLVESIRELVELSSKMGEINAYVGNLSLSDFWGTDGRIYECVKKYSNFLHLNYCKTQAIPEKTNMSVVAALLESNEIRDRILDNLMGSGIETRVYYKPLSSTPVATNVYSRILALPTHQQAAQNIQGICNIINRSM